MDTHIFFFSATVIFILVVSPIAYSHEADQFLECNGTFNCGTIQGIGYPFWGSGRPQYCGHRGFELLCLENQFPAIVISSQRFRVLNISRTGMVTVAPADIREDPCLQQPHNTSLDPNLFDFAATVRNLTIFYGCPLDDDIPSKNRFMCGTSNGYNYAYYLDESLLRIHRSELEDCGTSVTLPVNQRELDELWSGNDKIVDAWNKGFDVLYGKDMIPCLTCRDSGGVCGSDNTSLNFLCFCPDQPYSKSCLVPGSSFNLPRKLIGLITGGAISLIITCVIVLYFRRKIPFIISHFTQNDTDMEAFIRNNGTLSPKRYSYSDVRKMTNTFREQLGKGGYGSVFKGKLPDGHLVAVKVLNTTKGDGQEFINEVASISRTSHVNIVTLLGFCLEGRKRALIYEFMPNGSLERFIYKEGTMKHRQHLSSEELFRTAIGIARGLEYLHRGCNTRILHFDIKPHNILLDENFVPKIADFGLAKLCTTKESTV